MTRLEPDERRRLVASLVEQGVIHDRRIEAALLAVPREAFVRDDPFSDASADGSSSQRMRVAYADAPQPIGEGQTISAPHMVAIMAEALDVRPGHRVLEVGGGSGYHAAVLAHLAAPGPVTSVEVLPALARSARATLAALGVPNVEVVTGDGSEGYAPRAPYDRISVAAGAPSIPPPLLDQLAPGGVLLLPVGPLEEQTLVRVTKDGPQTPLMGVRFVPLVGKHGWRI